ncbi:MAG: hypothetical protein NTX80_02200 [Candidatus Saccharibacteria bacterium]|nr:hypothetical protein [Candidatus Saccharibacteria bacterium]
MKTYDIIGLIGAIFLLFGFYRTTIGKWTNKSLWYELDNVIGPVLLIIYQMHLHAYISVVLNAVWAIVAFKGITSYAERFVTARRSKQ